MHTKIFRRVWATGHQLAHKWFRKKKKIFTIYLKPFCKCAIVSKNIYIFYKNSVTFYRGLWGTVKMYKLTPSHPSPLCSLQRSGWWAHNKLSMSHLEILSSALLQNPLSAARLHLIPSSVCIQYKQYACFHWIPHKLITNIDLCIGK